MANPAPLICILIGRSGSGKGTQAKLLQKKLKLEYIGSGKLLRAWALQNNFTGRKLRKIMDEGYFVPTPILAKAWMDKLELLRERRGLRGFILDGSPRRLIEAELIDEALLWYEWQKRAVAILIDISAREATQRLLGRGRDDDSREAIRSRLGAYEREVTRVVAYYKAQKRLIVINGEQPEELVHKDIMKALKPSWI